MKPCIVYARFSPRPIHEGIDGQLDDPESIESQLDRNLAYCIMAKLEPRHVLRDPYVSAASSSLADRPEGRTLLELLPATRGGAGIRDIVIQRVDRMFRDAGEALQQAKKWRKSGITIHLTDQGGVSINSSTTTGRYMFGILALNAEYEAAITRERTSQAMTRHQHNGRRMSSYVPYGYSLDHTGPRNKKGTPTRIVPCEEEQTIIRWMLGQRDTGSPLRAIARDLAHRGVPCRGGLWSHTSVRKILARALANGSHVPA